MASRCLPGLQRLSSNTIAPAAVSPEVHSQVARVGETLAAWAGLRGLFGCDFLVEAGVPYINVICNQSNRGQDQSPEETDAFYKAHLQDLEERDVREVAVVRMGNPPPMFGQ